ncbi:MAG TPA: hypothetical protein DCL57_04735, partial [Microbacterium sp.]|nr:hypothetical protein [Microbacterium sp.]
DTEYEDYSQWPVEPVLADDVPPEMTETASNLARVTVLERLASELLEASRAEANAAETVARAAEARAIAVADGRAVTAAAALAQADARIRTLAIGEASEARVATLLANDLARANARSAEARVAERRAELERERELNTVLAAEVPESGSDIALRQAVLTLAVLGMQGDVPNLGSRKGIQGARKKLREGLVEYDNWSDDETLCASWILHFCKTIDEVKGGGLRRYAIGVIRHFVHTGIDELRAAQSVDFEEREPRRFESAFLPIVPVYTAAVQTALEVFNSVNDPLLLEGEMLHGLIPDEISVWAPAPPHQLLGGGFSVPMGLRVEEVGLPQLAADTRAAQERETAVLKQMRMLADFRTNLVVPYEDRAACEAAGGLYDKACGTMFMPPRTNLRPVEQWLPFELDADPAARNRAVHMDDHALIMHNPMIPRAAGPIKSDGSPNMSFGENIRVREMLKPPSPMRRMVIENPVRRTPLAAAEQPPPETEGVLIAGQLRAAAAAVAPMLAWICLVLALALFHENIWTTVNVVLVLVGHAYLATVGGLWGG